MPIVESSPLLTSLDLTEGWTFEEPKGKGWLAAQVPGCIHQDLRRHGLIQDPFHGCNELELGWVADRDWRYRMSFQAGPEIMEKEEVDLVFDGLDTVATVFLNGELLLRVDNMYHSHRLPVKKRLQPGENALEILFGSTTQYTATHRADFKVPHNFNDPGGECVRIRKQPCQFGWDWGPRLITAGIWRDVRLEGWSRNRIESVLVTQKHSSDRVTLSLAPELAQPDAGARFRTTISLDEEVLCSSETLELEITEPQLWWPSGQGGQPLYTVAVELLDSSEVVSRWSRRMGLRTIVLDQEADEFEVQNGSGKTLQRFGLRVNGRLIFAKGANWIPAHSFVAGLGRSDYAPLLQSAVAAHMNLIRVWGGGIYEHDCFYELCDELGLLVWQDFMFACNLYPADAAFLASIQREAEENIRRIRHHAALALWCGNNELVMLNADALKPGAGYVEGYREIFDRMLPDAVQRLDPATSYIASSPNYPLPESSEKAPPSHDEHDWNVWHARFPVDHYETTRHRFVSEFGMQSYPSPEIAATFCPPEELNLFSPTFDNHQKNVGGNQVIFDYVSRLYRFPKDYRAAAYLSQLNQAWCMKVAVEHWRRISPLCLGAVYWQLNDCWPVASWSSLEFGGKWKALQHEARRFFAPALVSVRQLGKEEKTVGNYVKNSFGPVEFHVVQDTPTAQSYRLRRRLCQLDGTVLDEREMAVSTEPQRGLLVEKVDFTALVEKRREDVYLRVELLAAEGEVCAENFSFFAAPRALHLRSENILSRWEQRSEREFGLTLESAAFQYAVCLELEGLQPNWSDNFFHLPAKEEKVITVTFAKPTEMAQLANLRVYSLVDSF